MQYKVFIAGCVFLIATLVVIPGAQSGNYHPLTVALTFIIATILLILGWLIANDHLVISQGALIFAVGGAIVLWNSFPCDTEMKDLGKMVGILSTLGGSGWVMVGYYVNKGYETFLEP